MVKLLSGNNPEYHETTALFSDDLVHRYFLKRIWKTPGDIVAFIGLNPSTADEEKNDPTVARCIGYAKRWGFGGMYMLNIFAYRSTDPKMLRKIEDPVGPLNDHYIICTIRLTDMVVACWGNHGQYMGRGEQVIDILEHIQSIPNVKIPIMCFKITKNGQPFHPLYLKKNQPLIDFRTMVYPSEKEGLK